jgi:hypothetical protein
MGHIIRYDNGYNHNFRKKLFFNSLFGKMAKHQWLTPIILATQEAEIRRIMVQG